MAQSWTRFLFIRLPLAFIAVCAVCQVIAIFLENVPMRRNRIDDLALAVVSDHQPHRIVLLGDSIVRNMTLRYAVGSQAEVLNLTTQGDVGLPGDLFLLSRYLESHTPPQHVVIAAAPDDYNVMPDPRMAHYYMWNTFTRPNERLFLKSYMPSIDTREDYPAVMDLQERILEKLIGVIRRTPARFPSLPPAPGNAASVEPVSDNQASVEATNRRATSRNLSLAPMYRAAIAQMCQLSHHYGFTLNLVWPPIPPSVLQGDIERGHLPTLEQQLKDVFATNGCKSEAIFNMNDVQAFTNFDSGAFHLRGSGWEQRGASILAEYLQRLPDPVSIQSKPSRAERQVSAGVHADQGF